MNTDTRKIKRYFQLCMLGNQKKMNYALRADMTEAEYVKEVTDGLLPPPAYFPLYVQLNQQGYVDIEDVVKKGSIDTSFCM